MNRRNAFGVEPAVRPLPDKALAPVAERLTPSVPVEVARVAAYLTGETVFGDLFGILKQEAVDKLRASPLGAEGATQREVARYELEALSTIESRLQSMAAEIRLHPGDE